MRKMPEYVSLKFQLGTWGWNATDQQEPLFCMPCDPTPSRNGMPPSSEHTLLPIDAPYFSWCPNLGDQGCTGIFQPKENYFLCFSFVPLEQTAGSFVQTMWAAELKNFCQLYTLSKQKVNKTHSSKLKCFKGKLQQLGFWIFPGKHSIY